MVRSIWERVETAAKGAAAGTGTSVDWEIMHGNLSLLPNRLITGLMQKNMESLGGITYNEAEQSFAETLYPSLASPEYKLGDEQKVFATDTDVSMGSTDVGDISWNVPTAEFTTATWVPGTPAHSWQAIAAGGTDIGIKGLQLAAKTMALTAADFFENPELAEQAHAELIEQRGADFKYTPLLGNRTPALDYRLKQ
jgi:aminobenzoyl-glutamate utilization protein B